MSASSPSIENIKTVIIESQLETKLLQIAQSPYALIGLINNTSAHVVASIRVPSGPMSVKWVSTFIKQLTAMLPGGIIPIGILNGQAEFTSLLEFSVEQSKVRCRRHSRTSKINITVKPQSKLTECLHCFRTQISVSLPLTSLNTPDFEGSLASFLQKSVPVLKDSSSDVTITKTNSVPLAKLQSSQHQIDFLLPTLQTRTELATIGRFEGTFTGIAYALPQASLADAADALQADLIQNSVYRWRLFQDFNVDKVNPAVNATCQLPKRIMFLDPDSQFYLCDYVFPDESLEEVNDRIQEYIGLENSLQSLDNCVEKFSSNSSAREQAPVDQNSVKPPVTKPMVQVLFALLTAVPVLIGIAFMIIMK